MTKCILAEITETIGPTPLAHVRRLSPEGGARIAAKLESFALSSVGGRTGVSMITAAEQAEAITPCRTTTITTAGR